MPGIQHDEVAAYHTFPSGAKRQTVHETRFDLIPYEPLRRLALRYSLGAKKYGENNWERGLPFDDTFNHVIDHLMRARDDIKAGIPKEDDDLAAAMWGICALMTFQEQYLMEAHRAHQAQPAPANKPR